MKFTIPSDEFMDNNYLLEEFSGVVGSFKPERINQDLTTLTEDDQRTMSWEKEKLEHIFSKIFDNIEMKETDEYTSPRPDYTFNFFGDSANFFPNHHYSLFLFKDRKSIVIEKMPMILFCKFLSDYCEAFPRDLPMILVLSITKGIARVTEDTTNEDLYIAFNKDPEETWKAVE